MPGRIATAQFITGRTTGLVGIGCPLIGRGHRSRLSNLPKPGGGIFGQSKMMFWPEIARSLTGRGFMRDCNRTRCERCGRKAWCFRAADRWGTGVCEMARFQTSQVFFGAGCHFADPKADEPVLGANFFWQARHEFPANSMDFFFRMAALGHPEQTGMSALRG